MDVPLARDATNMWLQQVRASSEEIDTQVLMAPGKQMNKKFMHQTLEAQMTNKEGPLFTEKTQGPNVQHDMLIMGSVALTVDPMTIMRLMTNNSVRSCYLVLGDYEQHGDHVVFTNDKTGITVNKETMKLVSSSIYQAEGANMVASTEVRLVTGRIMQIKLSVERLHYHSSLVSMGKYRRTLIRCPRILIDPLGSLRNNDFLSSTEMQIDNVLEQRLRKRAMHDGATIEDLEAAARVYMHTYLYSIQKSSRRFKETEHVMFATVMVSWILEKEDERQYTEMAELLSLNDKEVPTLTELLKHSAITSLVGLISKMTKMFTLDASLLDTQVLLAKIVNGGLMGKLLTKMAEFTWKLKTTRISRHRPITVRGLDNEADSWINNYKFPDERLQFLSDVTAKYTASIIRTPPRHKIVNSRVGKILIHALGSGGDVAVGVAAGKMATEIGLSVMMVVPEGNRQLCEDSIPGVKVVEVLYDQMKATEIATRMDNDPMEGIEHGMENSNLVVCRDYPISSIDQFNPEMVIGNPITIQSKVHAAHRGVPYISLAAIHWFLPQIMNDANDHPVWLTRVRESLITFSEHMTTAAIGSQIDEWALACGIPKQTCDRAIAETEPYGLCYSELFAKGPTNRTSYHLGYITPSRSSDSDAESYDCVLVFGSMTHPDIPKAASAIVKAIQEGGRSVCLVTGYSHTRIVAQLELDGVKPDKLYQYTPYGGLMNRCGIVIGHGGTGTFHEAILSNKYMVYIPFFGDQHYWSNRISIMGLGAKLRVSETIDSSSIDTWIADSEDLGTQVRIALCRNYMEYESQQDLMESKFRNMLADHYNAPKRKIFEISFDDLTADLPYSKMTEIVLDNPQELLVDVDVELLVEAQELIKSTLGIDWQHDSTESQVLFSCDCGLEGIGIAAGESDVVLVTTDGLCVANKTHGRYEFSRGKYHKHWPPHSKYTGHEVTYLHNYKPNCHEVEADEYKRHLTKVIYHSLRNGPRDWRRLKCNLCGTVGPIVNMDDITCDKCNIEHPMSVDSEMVRLVDKLQTEDTPIENYLTRSGQVQDLYRPPREATSITIDGDTMYRGFELTRYRTPGYPAQHRVNWGSITTDKYASPRVIEYINMHRRRLDDLLIEGQLNVICGEPTNVTMQKVIKQNDTGLEINWIAMSCDREYKNKHWNLMHIEPLSGNVAEVRNWRLYGFMSNKKCITVVLNNEINANISLGTMMDALLTHHDRIISVDTYGCSVVNMGCAMGYSNCMTKKQELYDEVMTIASETYGLEESFMIQNGTGCVLFASSEQNQCYDEEYEWCDCIVPTSVQVRNDWTIKILGSDYMKFRPKGKPGAVLSAVIDNQGGNSDIKVHKDPNMVKVTPQQMVKDWLIKSGEAPPGVMKTGIYRGPSLFTSASVDTRTIMNPKGEGDCTFEVLLWHLKSWGVELTKDARHMLGWSTYMNVEQLISCCVTLGLNVLVTDKYTTTVMIVDDLKETVNIGLTEPSLSMKHAVAVRVVRADIAQLKLTSRDLTSMEGVEVQEQFCEDTQKNFIAMENPAGECSGHIHATVEHLLLGLKDPELMRLPGISSDESFIKERINTVHMRMTFDKWKSLATRGVSINPIRPIAKTTSAIIVQSEIRLYRAYAIITNVGLIPAIAVPCGNRTGLLMNHWPGLIIYNTAINLNVSFNRGTGEIKNVLKYNPDDVGALNSETRTRLRAISPQYANITINPLAINIIATDYDNRDHHMYSLHETVENHVPWRLWVHPEEPVNSDLNALLLLRDGPCRVKIINCEYKISHVIEIQRNSTISERGTLNILDNLLWMVRQEVGVLTSTSIGNVAETCRRIIGDFNSLIECYVEKGTNNYRPLTDSSCLRFLGTSDDDVQPSWFYDLKLVDLDQWLLSMELSPAIRSVVQSAIEKMVKEYETATSKEAVKITVQTLIPKLAYLKSEQGARDTVVGWIVLNTGGVYHFKTDILTSIKCGWSFKLSLLVGGVKPESPPQVDWFDRVDRGVEMGRAGGAFTLNKHQMVTSRIGMMILRSHTGATGDQVELVTSSGIVTINTVRTKLCNNIIVGIRKLDGKPKMGTVVRHSSMTHMQTHKDREEVLIMVVDSDALMEDKDCWKVWKRAKSIDVDEFITSSIKTQTKARDNEPAYVHISSEDDVERLIATGRAFKQVSGGHVNTDCLSVVRISDPIMATAQDGYTNPLKRSALLFVPPDTWSRALIQGEYSEEVPSYVYDRWDDKDLTDHATKLGPKQDMKLRSSEHITGFKTIEKVTLVNYPIYSNPVLTKIANAEFNAVSTRLGSVVTIRRHSLDAEYEALQWLETYGHEHAITMSKSFQLNPINIDYKKTMEWVSERKGSSKVASELCLILEQGLALNRLNDLNVHVKLESLLKDIGKENVDGPAADDNKHASMHAVNHRIIVWQKKGICAIFAPVFLEAKKRFKQLLARDVVYADGLTPQQLSARCRNVSGRLGFLENDLSKQDRQTDNDTLDCEFAVYSLLGVNEAVLTLWRSVHKHWRLRGKFLRGGLDGMRMTGQATTALGNAIVNQLCHRRLVQRSRGSILLIMVLGDDLLILTREPIDDVELKREIASYYNMQSKADFSWRCGNFLRLTCYKNRHDCAEIGPDIVRLARRYEVTNGVSEATDQNTAARALSYAHMIGNQPELDQFREEMGAELPEVWYDIELVVQALMVRYKMSKTEVESHYNQLIKMVTTPNQTIHSFKIMVTALDKGNI
jgi:hypothetical protein